MIPDLKAFLDEKADQYNHPDFISTDPIQIPHLFSQKEDIEISGFLTATIAWGNRKSIIKSATRLMDLMGDSPYDFVMDHDERQLKLLDPFVHRTFNSIDLRAFVRGLKHIYTKYDSMEAVFSGQATDLQEAISIFKKIFFETEHLPRSEKHISDPLKGSAAKRINMYLRWMVRNDKRGVDFGLWPSILPSQLSCPLDVHSGKIARKLGLMQRKQNDAKALKELDTALRKLDPADPVKYDFALFGLGAFENF